MSAIEIYRQPLRKAVYPSAMRNVTEESGRKCPPGVSLYRVNPDEKQHQGCRLFRVRDCNFGMARSESSARLSVQPIGFDRECCCVLICLRIGLSKTECGLVGRVCIWNSCPLLVLPCRIRVPFPHSEFMECS